MQYIDVLYDFILGLGMKPFVELSFMPQALASGTQTIFWWRGNVTPPKDYDKWGALIGSLVQHFTDRYGKQEVMTLYFEVRNEPNLKDFLPALRKIVLSFMKFHPKQLKVYLLIIN